MIAERIEKEYDQKDGRSDAPPGSAVLVAAVGGRHHRWNEPGPGQELIDEHTENNAAADDRSQIGKKSSAAQHLIYNKYAGQIARRAGHE